MKITKYIVPLFFAFLGFLIYSNILYAPFIFDDELYIVTNQQIRNISNFLNDFSGTRYIGFLSFAINYYLGGLNTFGYHLLNVIIHILNAILVYVLIQLTLDILGERQKAMGEGLKPFAFSLLPFACSLIFLVHPIQTQAVSYIIQRFASLATLFYLLALVLYIKARLKGTEAKRLRGRFNLFPFSPFYLLSLFSAILAMKTKEISFTLPFMIALYEFTFFKNNISRIRRFLYLVPYFLTLPIIPLTLFIPVSNTAYGEFIRQLQTEELTNLSKYKYLLTQFNVIVTYIRLLFLPVNQHFEYDYQISNSIFEPATFLSFLFLLSIFGFAVYLYIRSRKTNNARGILASFGIFWFFITLSVESSIIPIKDVIFEHRLYLPSVGFILSIAAFYYYLFGHIGKNKTIRLILVLFIITAALSFSIAAYKRNIIYKDSVTILYNEVSLAPNRPALHNNLGAAYMERNMPDEAIREFEKTIGLNARLNKLGPFGLALLYKNLGVAYESKGLLDNAEKTYKISSEFLEYVSEEVKNTNFLKFIDAEIQVHTNLGGIYYKKRLLDKAVEEYKEAIKLAPSAILYNYLGNIYREKEMVGMAIIYYEKALKIDAGFREARESLDRLTK
ncbi:MAG: hypothetical protein HZB79_10440 [Deltaproteobacteria bacterium]|nr:hypothetical protein [Deltaproteobacteria bacterium]